MPRVYALHLLQLLEAMAGKPEIVECTFVESDVTELRYFSTPCRLGPSGVEENLGLPELSPFEQERLKEVGKGGLHTLYS